MKLLVLSDFHGSIDFLPKIPGIIKKEQPDVVAFCGDIVKGYARGDEWLRAMRSGDDPDRTLPQIEKEETQDLEFYEAFFRSMGALGRPVVFIPGNMDSPWERFSAAAQQAMEQYQNLHLIHQQMFTFQDFTFWGFGGELSSDQHEVFFVMINSHEEVVSQLPDTSEDDRLVLLTHSPPIGTVVDIENNNHRGSGVVNDLIDQLKPMLLFCGHAHSAQGNEKIDGTTVVNPGAFKSTNYAIVTVEGKDQEPNITYGKIE